MRQRRRRRQRQRRRQQRRRLQWQERMCEHISTYTPMSSCPIYQKKNRSTASTMLLHKTQPNLCVSTAYLSTHRFGCIAVQIVSLVYLIWILSFCLLIFCYFFLLPLSLSHRSCVVFVGFIVVIYSFNLCAISFCWFQIKSYTFNLRKCTGFMIYIYRSLASYFGCN